MPNVQRRNAWLAASCASVLCLGSLFSCADSASKRPDTANDFYIEVSKHAMHLTIEGSGPTVIIGAGSGVRDPALDFAKVSEPLKAHAKVAIYDRAGFGKSEATIADRDIDTVTDELALVFEKAGLQKTYLLVGHSIASLEILRFAQRYPDRVKGIVLIEGTPPDIMPLVMPDKKIEKAKWEALFGLMPVATYNEARWWKHNAAIIEKNAKSGNIPLYYICRESVDTTWLQKYSRSVQVIRTTGKEHSIHKEFPDRVAEVIQTAMTAEQP